MKRRAIPLILLSLMMTSGMISSGYAQCSFKLTGPLTIQAGIDNAPPGDSISDARYFSGPLSFNNNPVGTATTQSIVIDLPPPPGGIPDDTRMVHSTYKFSGSDALIAEGVQNYPLNSARLPTNLPMTRPITGGSGRFRNAEGEVTTTRLSDDVYERQFTLKGIVGKCPGKTWQ